jgi:phytoene dehydrogenase-like protein
MEPGRVTQRFDAVIVGAGHNGLVCAFYLARAGLKVRIVERRDVVGGAAVTEEFHPGFRNSVASYTVSLLQPKVIADMRCRARLSRDRAADLELLPQEDGGYLKLGGGTARTQAEFRKFSPAMPRALPAYYDALETRRRVLRGLALKAPPNVGEGCARWSTRARRAGGSPARPRAAARRARPVHQVGARLPRPVVRERGVKAAFGFDAVVGNYASPDTPARPTSCSTTCSAR